jgi:hypothetical protein
MANDSDKKNSDIAELERSIQEKMQKLDARKESSSKAQTVASSHSDADWWSVSDAMTISSAVLIFGSVIMLLATCLLYIGKNADDVLKLFGTIIIVISAVFLVVAGYTDTQIAPVIGLLGTIAGYLLGRESVENKVENKKNEPSK